MSYPSSTFQRYPKETPIVGHGSLIIAPPPCLPNSPLLLQIIDTHHVELAVRTSRKSVTDAELVEYASFSEKMKQQAEEELAAAGDAPVGSMKAFSFANNTKKK